MKDIGSEFWSVEKTFPHYHWWDNLGIDRKFFVFGRTALYALIDDICSNKLPDSVCMPDFCCETMIIPFIRHNIKVDFYHVDVKDETLHFEMKTDNSWDIFYITDYFGYNLEQMLELGKKAKSNGSIVIYDRTQSILTSPSEPSYAFDYIYCSFRKFSGLIGGGILIKLFDKINLAQNYTQETNYNYVEKKKLARKLKKEYIEEGLGDKSVFLRLKSEAEDILNDEFIKFDMDEETKNLLPLLDEKIIIKKRIENATFLHDALSDCKGIKLMFPSLRSDDCPLYVPILVSNGRRDELKQYLIDSNIYCPNHWNNKEIDLRSSNDIYDQELSLICDQRYGINDMKYEADVIRKFFGTN